jgi:uncharacterized damage-inducible protein DinB
MEGFKMIRTVTGQLQAARAVLAANLEGVDHDLSLVQPTPGGNCLNWILGHLVASYDRILPALGGEPVLSPEQKAVYARGGEPLDDPGKAVPFEELQRAFEIAHARVIEGLGRLSEERLGEPAPFSPTDNPDETLGSLLSVIAFHQAYHAGQTGLARRLVGLEGAIR